MDKNMIKIDDLLRQRLGDAEEQERPGAWLHMRDLLDQQMPVKGVPGGAFNWRRMFGYLGALVLLLAVSAGGYQVLHSFNSEAPLAANTGAGNPATPSTGLAGVASDAALPQELQENAMAAEEQEVVAGNTAQTGMATTQQTQQTATTDAPVTTNKKGAANTTNNNNQGNNSNNQQQAIVASNTTTVEKTVSNATKNNKTDIAPNSGNTATNAKAGNAANDNPMVNKATGQNKQEPGASQSVAGNNTTGNNATKNNKSPEPTHLEKEVPYQKIEIQEREGKNGLVKKDTIFNGEDVMKVKVPNNKELLALNKKDDNNSGANMNPAAAAPSANKEASEENAGMQKLGDHKVASKKMRNYNSNRFEEVVRNAKFRMGAIKFYPGIVGGINGTLNGNLGVHAGLAGNLSVSDRWSILAEVKYAHRLNFANDKKIQDDYITNVKFANVNGQGVYTYDSMEHYYNFGSYASLELPLMVTYSEDRWVYMLGGNFRYNFRISNLQEVEQRYLLEQSLTSTTEPKFSTEKQILLSDFTPSMNIAPMLGVGYQALPGLRLDLRASKSVWNNSTTFGQKEISKSLYNTPQVQFNITYRFRSTKPYKRAQ